MEKIIALKERIKNISLFIDTLEGSEINRLDKDILLQKIREFYLEVIDLNENHINNSFKPEPNHKAQIVSREEPIIVEFNKQETPANFIAQSTQEKIVEQTTTEITIIKTEEKEEFVVEFAENFDEVVAPAPEVFTSLEPEKIQEPIMPAEPEKTPIIAIVQEEIIIRKQVVEQATLFLGSSNSGVKTVGEQLGQNKTSLNEMLANRNNSDFSSRLKPITDIKSAIGVGDRFLFIRELFAGNNESFEETIVHLNSLSSFHDAQTYLTSKFGWDDSQTTVSTFVNIVKRRYV